MSFTCKEIIKQGSIVQPIAAVLDLNMEIEKQPSVVFFLIFFIVFSCFL